MKLRRQAGRLNRTIHRLPSDEINGITIGKYNFRFHAEQVIARRAVMDNIEKHIIKERLGKHARVMLDSMVPGPEFERMTVQNRFKGLRLQREINLVCKKYYEEIYETMDQWLEERRYYDDDIS
uniref:Uncharacterized protein n=1 Tax=Lotharella oceanica TaxID=641309 RepID=A0A7S2X9Y8_9EUKA|mmetsp:Transcript_17081/g.32401  ORF Transcript_17081/g.32401 Transcript_17081/m.32401 type:complete len:124 (+) Transcript_17081:57-428(+)